MLRWWMILMLVFSASLGRAVHAEEVPAAAPMSHSGATDSEQWARLQVKMVVEDGTDVPSVLILMGFDSVEADSGRPGPDARPVYQETLAEGSAALPHQIERRFRRELFWFVMGSDSVPPGPHSWMSDPLDLSSGSTTIRVGAERAVEDLPEEDDAGIPMGEGLPRMNWGGLLWLGSIPLLLGWLVGREEEEDGSSTRRMAVHALLAGILFALCSDLWLANFHLQYLTSSPDLLESCDGVISLTSDTTEWPGSRSRLAGLMPALFGVGLGVLDGLAWAAWVAAAIVGAGIFTWARLLGGLAAGWIALAAALTIGPLTHLPRLLSFYPEIAAALTWGAVGTTAVVLRASHRTAAWAGTGIGLCLLVDAAGLPFALILGTVAALAIVIQLRRDCRWTLLSLVFPVLLSWPMARVAYPKTAVGLQDISVQVLADSRLTHEVESVPEGEDSPRMTSLVWGWTPLSDLPAATLGLIGSWPSADERVSRTEGVVTRDNQVLPWMPMFMISLPLAGWAALRRRGRWGAPGRSH